jgi:hypothetical protein
MHGGFKVNASLFITALKQEELQTLALIHIWATDEVSQRSDVETEGCDKRSSYICRFKRE